MPVVVPAPTSGPVIWSGRVVSVNQSDLHDLITNYQHVTVAATNSTAAPGGTAPGDLSDTAAGGYYLSENGADDYQLEDGSGRYLLENTAFVYRNLSLQKSQNQDGTVTTYGSLETFEAGFLAGQTFKLTSTNFGISAQAYTITNVTMTFLHTTPLYGIEFGDAYQTLQKAGGGVLTQVGSQATIQQGAAVPAGTLGYAQVTANQTGISAATDLTGLTVTVTVASGRRIRISAVIWITQQTSSATPNVNIQEGATVLQNAGMTLLAGGQTRLTPSIPVQPTAGVHTYKLNLTTGAGTVDLDATATVPAYILVEDIGV